MSFQVGDRVTYVHAQTARPVNSHTWSDLIITDGPKLTAGGVEYYTARKGGYGVTGGFYAATLRRGWWGTCKGREE